jgi:hypothetical protein
MKHDELTPILKEIGKSLLSVGTVEDIAFLDLSGQFAALSINLVALTCQLFSLINNCVRADSHSAR